jgi:BlaI family penicillinase repressor
MIRKKAVLSDAEWRIMRLLWERSPLSCRQIETALKEETGWTRHDIFSFVKRMEAKGALRREEASPQLYYPLLGHDEAVAGETRSFVGKLWDGNLGLMVSTMIKNEQLDEAEIDELLRALQEAKKARGGGQE